MFKGFLAFTSYLFLPLEEKKSLHMLSPCKQSKRAYIASKEL